MGAEMIFIVDHAAWASCSQLGRENNVDIAKVVAVMIVMVVIGMVADHFGLRPTGKTRLHAVWPGGGVKAKRFRHR